MGLVDDECAYGVKVSVIVFLERQGLEHGDDKVRVRLFFVLLHHTYGRPWTELSYALFPLVREKLLVHDNHGSVSQFTRYGQGHRGLAIAARKRKNSVTCFESCSKCGVLMRGVSEGSRECDSRSNRFGAAVLTGSSKLINSVESWNAHSILSFSINFKRWRGKSKVSIDLGSYRQLFFYFREWTIFHDVPTSRQH